MESDISENISYSDVSLDQLPSLIPEIYDFGKDENIWLFKAQMGGGKTTFISNLCTFLEVEDHVSSPTFGLVNEYYSDKVEEIYHFDFYRIKNEQEAFEIGVEEYFYSDKLCLIEWPEMIPSFIPDQFLLIEIELSDDRNKRNFKISKHG
ncbi:tRNA (adenosine(37)-N6)-threonylcarbamoyltransferase complex ATPase subunit type 1 TsaE [Marivirga arenosa]|uniref:tRNA threonylcarbamoyladenosine biosynthesis protein TsaE n=1 Tax=Marivirga arenosa TaxID=3059076 RepID=A0AA49JCU4_9BACT|nr:MULTISPECIES: tRNA (adenosine(37)-N6)-threonylcarbamoyltransferase complex ATPase subunit type 1 TsaE [unclassified Marivirga]WKK81690.2 tRNA (adenosine(37)-N6)-threonylcarbamoyltransferase complex ATPase subunit type 1 TsaE [Marivirga sp. BKB1-2]WKK87541.2 tRNA (adenosine(37)-N6)-threonylcarbamoyltransferase complex ATPase subunit type 1 TsaE [Marivirga sp. ABR2-2]